MIDTCGVCGLYCCLMKKHTIININIYIPYIIHHIPYTIHHIPYIKYASYTYHASFPIPLFPLLYIIHHTLSPYTPYTA
ncbi:hypothetical protein EON63_13925 [archaeon]|nr:MAG: hypothetical protein EON63_13925 [archaeon]